MSSSNEPVLESPRHLQALRRPASPLRRRPRPSARVEVYGLIGPNGAGKTTFFNVHHRRSTRPDGGSFQLGGSALHAHAVHKVAKAGIARTFQNIRLFAEMTALENVMVGRHVRTKAGLLGAVLRTPGPKAEEAAIAKRAHELLDYVGIGKYADCKSRTPAATATSAAWRSPARWPPTPSCWRSTSRPPA